MLASKILAPLNWNHSCPNPPVRRFMFHYSKPNPKLILNWYSRLNMAVKICNLVGRLAVDLHLSPTADTAEWPLHSWNVDLLLSCWTINFVGHRYFGILYFTFLWLTLRWCYNCEENKTFVGLQKSEIHFQYRIEPIHDERFYKACALR